MFEDDYGVQSYFGESDSDFFGDTSNDMIFGEGYGEQAVDGSQFFSEAVGFSSDGGEFINEATAFDMDGEVFTELDSSIPNSTDYNSHGRREWIKSQEAKRDKAASDAFDKSYSERDRKARASGDFSELPSLEAGMDSRKVFRVHDKPLRDERAATGKHSDNMYDTKLRHSNDTHVKAKAKADGARPVSAQNSASSGTPIKRSSDGKVVGRSYPAGAKRLDGKSNK